MIYKHLYITLFIACFLVASCEPNIENLNLPVPQRYTILECYLTPNYPPELTLTNSNNLDEELLIRNLWYADVNIYSGEETYPLKNIFYIKPDRKILVNYRADDTLRIDMHQQFELSITTREQVKLSATTGIVAPVRITECLVEKNRIDVAYAVENGKADYLKLSIFTFVAGKKLDDVIRYYDASEFSGQMISIPWKYQSKFDTVIITLCNIQKDYYDYGVSIQNAVSAYHDPLLTPESIKSNVKGGIGIFTFYTFDQVKVGQ
jgi:hypothetical protein